MQLNPGLPVAVAVTLLLGLVLTGYAVGRLPHPGATAVAVVRAVVQLGVIALLISGVVNSLALSALLLALMFAVAVATTSRRVGVPRCWPYAGLAMAAGVFPVVVIVLASRAVPLEGIAVIPVVSIVLGGAMTAHTLLGRRAFAALREEHGCYEAGLSLGLSRSEAISEVIHRRTPEALVPGLDQVSTAGVVTLPGAFIGVLLGGGSPVQAATAQVLVLLGIMAAQTLTVVAGERLIGRAQLLPPDLVESLRP